MDAVTVNSLNTEVFADVLKNGAKLVKDTGCAVVPETYLKIIDDYTDWQIEREAARRLQEDDGEYLTQEEVMARLGMTMADLDGWEDVEIE